MLASLTQFLDRRLRLKVNFAKSAVDRPWKRSFLGYTMTWHPWPSQGPRLKVAKTSEKHFKAKLKAALRRGRGRNLQQFIKELTPISRGWLNYFKLAEVKGIFEELDGWLRRKLRCMLWRQWKRVYTRARNLMSLARQGWSGRRTCLALRHQRTWSLVECRCFAHERCLP